MIPSFFVVASHKPALPISHLLASLLLFNRCIPLSLTDGLRFNDCWNDGAAESVGRGLSIATLEPYRWILAKKEKTDYLWAPHLLVFRIPRRKTPP